MPNRSFLHFCLLLTVVLTGFASTLAQTQQLDLPEGNREPPKLGVRVIEIIPDGQAEAAGVQTMDLLAKYGKFKVVDHSTYYKAREFYLRTPKEKVKVVFWRGRSPYTIEVLPGYIGMDTNEYNAAGYQLDAVIKHAEVMDHVPEYLRQVEFKAEFEKQGVDALLRDAREMIDRLEADGSLTSTQILVARIRSTLDNAPEEELKQQDVLIGEFLRSQATEYIGYLGGNFVQQDHFRPARALLKHYLLTDPDNVPVRVNLGYVNTKLGQWADVEADADLLLSNPEELDPHELSMVHQQKALGALSRNDYDMAIVFAEKAFAHEADIFQLFIVHLAAALKGDLEKLDDISRTFQQKMPKDYETFKFPLDSARALALAVNGQDELAREVIGRWAKKDRAEGRLKDFWRHYPQGNKAVENWMRLAAKN
jgi:hypothetical protein